MHITGIPDNYPKGSFGYDLEFLKQYHNDVIVLGEESAGAAVIILPAYQGRVMTSTTEGLKGKSFGWVNHDLIASRKQVEHIHAYGGEERLWLGPEGGQFSVYFKKDSVFTFDNWYVPAAFDTEPFNVISTSATHASFKKAMRLQNYSGYVLELEINRTVRLLEPKIMQVILGVNLPAGIKAVGFESENKLTNTGDTAWNKQGGMLSIWILCMMNASDNTYMAIPYKKGDLLKLGKIVTDDYFGKVPANRLQVADGLILFKADATHRSKIGISPARALPFAISYDATNQVLTVAHFTLHEGVTDYVNSLWQLQEDPFAGDAVNAYNDGPINGSQMGRFYEMESSSPAAALKPGQAMLHRHAVMHFTGPKEDLNKISMKLLNIPVDAISL